MRGVVVVGIVGGVVLGACAHAGWRSVVEARAATCTLGTSAVVEGVVCRCVDVEIGCQGTPDPGPDDPTHGRVACVGVEDERVDGQGCPVRLPVEQGDCARPATAGSAWGCPFLVGDAVQIWRCVHQRWTAAPEDCRHAM